MKPHHWINKNCVSQAENYSGSMLKSADLLADGSGNLQVQKKIII